MTSFTWKGVGGDWNDPDNWTPAGGPPTSADHATIHGSSSADIITVDTADAAHSLTLSGDAKVALDIHGASASLSVDSLAMNSGALNVSSSRDGGLLALNGGTLDQTGGRLTLSRGGTISDGTIDAAGGHFRWQGGTLDAIAYEGTLNLLNGHVGHVTGGLAMSGASGRGRGAIVVEGGSHLYFDGSQTLSNATIYLGTFSEFDYLRANDTASVGDQVLTLASNVTIDLQGSAVLRSGSASGDGIVNDGLIQATGPNIDLIIDPTTFVNNGTIAVEHLDRANIKTAVTGTGTDVINFEGHLQFDAGVSTAATLGDQKIEFAAPGGPRISLLRLMDPLGFYGEISGFGAHDQVNLLGDWAFSGISQAGGATTLTVSNGSTTHGFEFQGDYTQSNFSFHTQANGVTAIAYA